MHTQQPALAERSRSHNLPATLRLRSGFGYRVRILGYYVINRISYYD